MAHEQRASVAEDRRALGLAGKTLLDDSDDSVVSSVGDSDEEKASEASVVSRPVTPDPKPKPESCDDLFGLDGVDSGVFDVSRTAASSGHDQLNGEGEGAQPSQISSTPADGHPLPISPSSDSRESAFSSLPLSNQTWKTGGGKDFYADARSSKAERVLGKVSDNKEQPLLTGSSRSTSPAKNRCAFFKGCTGDLGKPRFAVPLGAMVFGISLMCAPRDLDPAIMVGVTFAAGVLTALLLMSLKSCCDNKEVDIAPVDEGGSYHAPAPATATGY